MPLRGWLKQAVAATALASLHFRSCEACELCDHWKAIYRCCGQAASPTDRVDLMGNRTKDSFVEEISMDLWKTLITAQAEHAIL
jgi:hypothetical protein